VVAAAKGRVAVNSDVLHHVRARCAKWLALRAALAALAIVCGLTLVVLLSDAALELPEQMRAAVPWLLGVAIIAALGAGLLEWRRLTEARLARLLEQSDATLGNRLINAVQLAEESSASGTEEFFRREAVALGCQSAKNLVPWPVVRGGIKRAGGFFGSTLLAWIALMLLNSDLVQTVLPRLFDPHGDHPPYSRLRIEVKADKSEVLYGGQIEVRAVTHGMPTDKLWLVAKSGTNETRAIMFLAPDKSFFQTLVNLRERTEYFVTDGTARSRKFFVGIRFTPQITMVEVAETFPEYTGKPARTGKLSDEPQSLPEGTRVAFRVASNRPLKSGALTLTPVLGGKTNFVTLLPETQNTVVTGAFVLSEPVVFDLSVRDVTDLDSLETKRGRFNILPDRPPKIFMLEPGRDAVATPDIRVPVRVRAEDDYAVSRVAWLRSLNSSFERPLEMKLALRRGPQSVEASGAFNLDELGVRPGDLIEYYFEAADNYPAGPNVAFSRPFKLQIISREQYEAILRQAAARKALFEEYFKLDAWMRRLAERSRNLTAQAEHGDPTARAEAEELAKQLAKYDEALAKLMQEPVMFDVENSFRAALGEQQAQLGHAAEKLTKALAGSGTPDSKALRELSDQLTGLAKTQDEQVKQPAQQIASVVSVVSRADAFVRLAQQQAELAQLLRRFADKTDALTQLEQMEVQELTHQQQRIAEALHELLGQLPELLAKVPPDGEFDPLRGDVNNFLKAVSDAKIEELLSNAAKTLEQPDTMTGHALAQTAAEEMDKLIAKCNSLGDNAQQCSTAHFQPKLTKPGLGNTLQQILAALKSGNGQGGRDGYALFDEDVALYGPNVELAGEQAGDHGDNSGNGTRFAEIVSGNAPDTETPPNEAQGRVRLQPDAKFPLRYRELVGEYFRVMAESENGGEK
jgi:3-methyladenine DNA glycosylase Tag